jgi:hypothetical protein
MEGLCKLYYYYTVYTHKYIHGGIALATCTWAALSEKKNQFFLPLKVIHSVFVAYIVYPVLLDTLNIISFLKKDLLIQG